MTAPNSFVEVMTNNPKLLTFHHEHDGGFNHYHVVVPGDYEAPKGTIGNQPEEDEDPDTLEKYLHFVKRLEIPFDLGEEGEFLWCSEAPMESIQVLSKKDLP